MTARIDPLRAWYTLRDIKWMGVPESPGPGHAFVGASEISLCGAYRHPKDETRRHNLCQTCWGRRMRLDAAAAEIPAVSA